MHDCLEERLGRHKAAPITCLISRTAVDHVTHQAPESPRTPDEPSGEVPPLRLDGKVFVHSADEACADFEVRGEAVVKRGPDEPAQCYCMPVGKQVDVTGECPLACLRGGRILPAGPRTFPCSGSARP
jgi:hypothetical protein